MGCITPQLKATDGQSSQVGFKPLAELPTIQFISADCNGVVQISKNKVSIHPLTADGLSRNCPSVSYNDSIYVLSGGLEGDPAFWELTTDGAISHPVPPVSVVGGTFIVHGRRLLLVGAKFEGTKGGFVPAHILAFDTKKKKWSGVVDASVLEAKPKVVVHPALLTEAGVALRRGEPDLLIFAGGVYNLNGKPVHNDKLLWLDLNSNEFGEFFPQLPVALKNPHVAALSLDEILVAGGTVLSTKKKSKRTYIVNTANKTVTELTPLRHVLATTYLAPVSTADYIVFFSWPRVVFYNKTRKTFISKSLRKSDDFRSLRLKYKRHDSMQSDLSSVGDADLEMNLLTAGPHIFVKKSIGVEGSYGIPTGNVVVRTTFNSKALPSKIPESSWKSTADPVAKVPKTVAKVEAEPTVKTPKAEVEVKTPKAKVEITRSKSRKSKKKPKVVVTPAKKVYSSSEDEVEQAVTTGRRTTTDYKTPSGQIDVQVVKSRRSDSDSSDSDRQGVPGTISAGISSLSKVEGSSLARTGLGNKLFALNKKKQRKQDYQQTEAYNAKVEIQRPAIGIDIKQQSSSDEEYVVSKVVKKSTQAEGPSVTISGPVFDIETSSKSVFGAGKKGHIAVHSSESEEEHYTIKLADASTCNEILAEVAGYDADYTEFMVSLIKNGTTPSETDLRKAMELSIPSAVVLQSSVFSEFFVRLATYLKVKPLSEREVSMLLEGARNLVKPQQAVDIAVRGFIKLLKRRGS